MTLIVFRFISFGCFKYKRLWYGEDEKCKYPKYYPFTNKRLLCSGYPENYDDFKDFLVHMILLLMNLVGWKLQCKLSHQLLSITCDLWI